jgi:hypothetical protein
MILPFELLELRVENLGGDHRQPPSQRKAGQRAPETRKFAPLI